MKFLKNFGIFLIPFSIFYFLVLDNFTYLSIIMLGFGLFLLLISWLGGFLKWKLSIGWQLIIVVAPFVWCILAFLWYRRPYYQKIIVPDGYRGMVVISYENKRGKPEERDGWDRIIKINSSGFAATKSVWDPMTLDGTNFYYESRQDSAAVPFYLVQNIDLKDTSRIYVHSSDSNMDYEVFILESEGGRKKYFEDCTFDRLRPAALSIYQKIVDQNQ